MMQKKSNTINKPFRELKKTISKIIDKTGIIHKNIFTIRKKNNLLLCFISVISLSGSLASELIGDFLPISINTSWEYSVTIDAGYSQGPTAWTTGSYVRKIKVIDISDTTKDTLFFTVTIIDTGLSITKYRWPSHAETTLVSKDTIRFRETSESVMQWYDNSKEYIPQFEKYPLFINSYQSLENPSSISINGKYRYIKAPFDTISYHPDPVFVQGIGLFIEKRNNEGHGSHSYSHVMLKSMNGKPFSLDNVSINTKQLKDITLIQNNKKYELVMPVNKYQQANSAFCYNFLGQKSMHDKKLSVCPLILQR